MQLSRANTRTADPMSFPLCVTYRMFYAIALLHMAHRGASECESLA